MLARKNFAQNCRIERGIFDFPRNDVEFFRRFRHCFGHG
jgi:hypothetical protein